MTGIDDQQISAVLMVLQGDIELQNFASRISVHLHIHRLRRHRYIFAHYRQQLFLQLGQLIRPPSHAALTGHDDLQTLLGD